MNRKKILAKFEHILKTDNTILAQFKSKDSSLASDAYFFLTNHSDCSLTAREIESFVAGLHWRIRSSGEDVDMFQLGAKYK